MKTFIDRLSLRAKFAIAGLVGVASMLTALGVLVSTMNQNIAFSAKERLGVAYHKPLREFLASVIAVQADPAAKSRVAEAVAAVDKAHQELGGPLDIGDRWEKAKSRWQAASDSAAGLTPVIDEAAALMDHVGNTSNLILDPDLDSYYLMDIAVTRVPHLARKLAFLREQGAGVLESRAMPGETRTALSTTAGVSVGFRDAVKASVDTAVASNSDLKEALHAPLETLLSRADAFLGTVERDVLSADRLQMPAAGYRTAAEQALAANFAFYDVVSPALDGLLGARIAGMKWKRNMLISVVVGLMVLAGALGVMITRGIVRSAHDAASVAERMARGDLAFDLPHASGDELGAMIRAMGSMKASINASIAEIRALSIDLLRGSDDLSSAAGEVTVASHEQMQFAASAATAVEQVTVSIDSITQNAEAVRTLSTESLERSRHGNAEMARLASEMGEADRAVAHMAQAVGEFMSKTAEITGMTRQVKDLADQTNLLALNAAIEAARAGEFGRGFAVVADEVRKLAERSGAAANEIDRITQALGVHSDQVGAAITQGRVALEESRTRAMGVAQVLNSAEGTVGVAATGMHEIVSSVGEQHAAAASIARSVEEVARMAEANHAAATRAEAGVSALRALSDRLESAVSRFVVEERRRIGGG